MSSAHEGWYVDPSTGTNLRYWSGSTWTDEVAPMPQEPAHSGEVDLFAAHAEAQAQAAAQAAAQAQAEAPTDDAPAPDTETPAAEELPQPDLDPEVERTQLTRRELRARRGTESAPDDTPKHLPPMTPPSAVSNADWQEPVEEVEIPLVSDAAHAVPEVPDVPPAPETPAASEAPEASGAPDDSEAPQQRRRQIIRMSVLLGILAVASSIAVLTAGTL